MNNEINNQSAEQAINNVPQSPIGNNIPQVQNQNVSGIPPVHPQGVPNMNPNQVPNNNVRPPMPPQGVQGQANNAQGNIPNQNIQPGTRPQTSVNGISQSVPNINPTQVPNNNVRPPMPPQGIQGQTTNVQGNIPNQNIQPGVRPQAPVNGIPQSQPNTNQVPRPVPIQPIEQQIGIPNVQSNNIAQPQITEKIEPIVKEEPKVEDIKPVEISPSVIEDNNSDDTASVTFDYNALYGVNNDTTNTNDAPATINDKPLFTESEVVITSPSFEDRTKTDVTPEFNINALDGSSNKEDNKLTDNVLSDKQQDKADTRRKLMFIGAIVLILIIFVGFIFPILNGYK